MFLYWPSINKVEKEFLKFKNCLKEFLYSALIINWKQARINKLKLYKL